MSFSFLTSWKRDTVFNSQGLRKTESRVAAEPPQHISPAPTRVPIFPTPQPGSDRRLCRGGQAGSTWGFTSASPWGSRPPPISHRNIRVTTASRWAQGPVSRNSAPGSASSYLSGSRAVETLIIATPDLPTKWSGAKQSPQAWEVFVPTALPYPATEAWLEIATLGAAAESLKRQREFRGPRSPEWARAGASPSLRVELG